MSKKQKAEKPPCSSCGKVGCSPGRHPEFWERQPDPPKVRATSVDIRATHSGRSPRDWAVILLNNRGGAWAARERLYAGDALKEARALGKHCGIPVTLGGRPLDGIRIRITCPPPRQAELRNLEADLRASLKSTRSKAGLKKPSKADQIRDRKIVRGLGS